MQEKTTFSPCVCMYLLTMEIQVSLFMCVCLSMCMWLNKGQDSISVFGHGAGLVAKGVFLALLCGLPVERSRQSLSHTSPVQTAQMFSLHLLSLSPSLSLSLQLKSFYPRISVEVALQQECLAGSPKHLSSTSFSTT